jgi:hypothetical protein
MWKGGEYNHERNCGDVIFNNTFIKYVDVFILGNVINCEQNQMLEQLCNLQ